MKPLDPTVVEILNKYDLDPKECLWDCKGTWVMLHRHLERVAAKAGVTFDYPEVVESEDSRIALLVRGKLGDREEWTIGEAAPPNNKNSYPWAMAEKRVKDRLTLKLLGLHGHVYSEEEAEEFKAPFDQSVTPEAPQAVPVVHTPDDEYRYLVDTIGGTQSWSRKEVLEWWNSPDAKKDRSAKKLTKTMVSALIAEINRLHPHDSNEETGAFNKAKA